MIIQGSSEDGWERGGGRRAGEKSWGAGYLWWSLEIKSSMKATRLNSAPFPITVACYSRGFTKVWNTCIEFGGKPEFGERQKRVWLLIKLTPV